MARSEKAEDTLLRLQWSDSNKITLQRDGKQQGMYSINL